MAGDGAGGRLFDFAKVVLPARRALGLGPKIQRRAKQVLVAGLNARALAGVQGPLSFGFVNVSEVADAQGLG